MKNLKKMSDFQKENQSTISNLEIARVIGGRASVEDCTCTENWSTSGGSDTDTWVYLDTSNGKKFISHNGSTTP